MVYISLAQGAALKPKNFTGPSRLRWPEWAAIAALAAAAGSLLIFGGVLSAIAFLLAAIMGWERPFIENAAKGKGTLSSQQRLIVGVGLAVVGVALLPGRNEAPVEKAPSKVAVAAGELEEDRSCPQGVPATLRDYGVAAEATLLQGPQKGAGPVQMTLAGSVLPAPLELDATVRELCRGNGWSRVRVLSAPSEIDPLYGWVPSSALRGVKTRPDGHRLYEVGDFDWPDGSKPYRAAVVSVVNRIMSERPDCQALDHSSLVMNMRGPKPVFSIPCFDGGDMKGFDFSPEDAKNGRSFAAVDPIGKMDAIAGCKTAVLGRAAHPSTVEFPTFDYDYRSGGDGKTQLLMLATAQNAFGLKLAYDVQCDFNGSELIDFVMSEADGQP